MTDGITGVRLPHSLPLLAKTLLLIGCYLLLGQPLSAQNMWVWNQRTHPELHWQTIETEHFKIHFHQGIEGIARKGAAIAEQAYHPIMDQLRLADFGKTDIVFSAEDEIMNGFAMPSDQIFIWVSQNDVAGHFSGSDKWLEMVVTHEFQHVAQFQAHRTWLGIFSGVTIPIWWYEGMAEYMTEVWRVGRSDSRMKIHTYRNTMNQLDPHDDGYAKVLYLAWKYGDSTLVNISRHRLYLNNETQAYPLWYDFGTAFKASTGQSLASFNEEWRRVMNTYYYGYKAQKEQVEEVGEPLALKGLQSVRSIMLSNDGSRVVIIGRRDRKMRDYGLYIMNTDSIQEIEELHYGRFSGRPTLAPDNSSVVVSEYHRGDHGSLIYDLRLVDLNSRKTRWLTQGLRSHHPVFSANGQGVFFVAHPGETTQIYYQDIPSGKRVRISNFVGDTQVRDLDLSPDGQRLSFSIQDESGDVDIAMMTIDGTFFKKVTNDSAEDLFPIWTTNGEALVFTSYRNGTPNLYRVNLDSLEIIQMTDVAGGIYSRQRVANTEKIIASTLPDVDTLRILTVDVNRLAPDLDMNIRTNYAGWRSKAPDIKVPEIRIDATLIDESSSPYHWRKNMRPLAHLVWPDIEGLFGMAIYNDALGKHLIQGGAVLGWDGSLQGGYASYLNLKFKPAVHVFASKDLVFNLRRSFKHLYVESRNGGGVAFQIPMNAGNSLSSNHTLRMGFQAIQRELRSSNTVVDGRIGSNVVNSSSTESNLGVTYIWKSQRPHQDQYILPKDGLGFLAHMETTLPAIYGKNDYQQAWAEGFFNYDIPKTPLVLFSRLKWIAQEGSILEQDRIGFSPTSSFYFSNAYWNTLKGTGLFDTPESYSLRGQSGEYFSDELIYSVTELRIPVLSKVPLNILGVGVQHITAAAYYDFGYIPEGKIDLHTFGAELKFDVSFSKISLFTMALGYGGDSEYWMGEGNNQDAYFRMALVNPL